MPHDMNGTKVEVGDVVLIPCKVTHVGEGEEYCNLNLESLEYMYLGAYKSTYTANAKQVVKQGIGE